MLFEQTGKFLAGELAILIGIEDLRGAVVLDSLFQGFDAEVNIQRIGKPPGEHSPGMTIHHGHQILKAFGHRNVNDVSGPDRTP